MLEARALSKIYLQGAGELHAVEEVDLMVSPAEKVYVRGPSGAGKSTLLHMLGGLDKPSRGSVTFKGSDIYRLSGRNRSRVRNASFGFVFQFYHLLPELSALENVMLPALIKGSSSRKDIRTRAMDLLDKVGISHRASHRPSRLSGGEAQRAAIARALVNEPEVLFCDEPTGNLDSSMSEEIYRLLFSISSQSGMSVVVVSHQELDSGLFTSEYYMKDGRIKALKVSEYQSTAS
ncbi:MAG: ATP-binding cassette domain-containing protein [Candidatus Omnitrophica bacterium]|nr:ATP-binding cassette domain-containing protein [Candidatus Omnitrophota bacterium]